MRFDHRRLAILAVLIALNSVVRLMGAGIAGMETAFAILIIAGSVFGFGFGFALGTLSILVSSVISGGIGPWLPFQMLLAALVGGVSGWLPKPDRLPWRLGILSLYGIFASYLYGLSITALTLPLFVGLDSPLAFDASRPLTENLARLVIFDFTTGGFIWNTGRAVTTVSLIWLTGKTLIAALERTTTRVFVKFEA